MVRFIFYLILIFSISQASDFQYYKKKFSNMRSYDVANFLYHHTSSDPYRKYATSHKFGYTYNYRTSNGEYFIDFGPYTDSIINVTKYKNLNRFVDDITKIINKTVCNDPIFKASLHSKTKLNFKIYDDRGNVQSKFTYSINRSPSCTFY